MFKNIIIAGLSLVLATNVMAKTAERIDVNEFLKELKKVQKEMQVSKKPEQNINNEIDKLFKQKRYKKAVANTNDETLYMKDIKGNIRFFKDYIFLLNNKLNSLNFIYGESYFKIKDKGYLLVSQNDVEHIAKEVFNLKMKILKAKRILSLLNKINEKNYLSDKAVNILADVKRELAYKENNYNQRGNNINSAKEFCSIDKLCFGYKIKSINSKYLTLGF